MSVPSVKRGLLISLKAAVIASWGVALGINAYADTPTTDHDDYVGLSILFLLWCWLAFEVWRM